MTNHTDSDTDNTAALTLADFHAGQRVAIHPASDLWMRGVRYGTVTRVGKLTLFVRADSGHGIYRVSTRNVLRIITD